MPLLKALIKGISSFFKDGCVSLAAALSYFSIISLVPLSILIITVIGYILGNHPNLYNFILTRLVSLFPTSTHQITEELRKVIRFKSISEISLLIYILLAINLFTSLEHSMNIIFKISKKRPIIKSIFLSVIVVTLMSIFLIMSFLITSMAIIIRHYRLTLGDIRIGEIISVTLRFVAPFFLVLLTFTSIFKIIPQKRVTVIHAFKGALISTVLWELAKHFFTWYYRYVIRLGSIYGSLTILILFLLWVYYSSCIFLLGAEIVHNLEIAPKRHLKK